MPELEPIYHRLGARIRALREERGFTQQELADDVGLSRAALVNMEQARQRISLHHLERLGEHLGVPWLALAHDEIWEKHDVEQIAAAHDSY